MTARVRDVWRDSRRKTRGHGGRRYRRSVSGVGLASAWPAGRVLNRASSKPRVVVACCRWARKAWMERPIKRELSDLPGMAHALKSRSANAEYV